MAHNNERASLTLVREYKAPPEKVWSAWTSAEALKLWMAPSADFTIPVVEVDLRVGGRYRFVMRSPDGVDNDVSGVYRDVIPNRKLVFTWAWKSTPERESLVTIEVQALGTGSRLTLTHTQFADETARDHHQKGWIGCLGQLEHFLAQ